MVEFREKVIKAGIHIKAVFWLGIMFLIQISRLHFKQSRISMLISHIYVLSCFVLFLIGLVKFMEIGNLVLF